MCVCVCFFFPKQPFYPPLLPSDLTTSQRCLTWTASNEAQRPAFILLLTVKASWVHTPWAHMQRDGRGYCIMSRLWGTPGIKEALWYIHIYISTVATAAITTLIHIDSLLYTFNQPGNTLQVLWSSVQRFTHQSIWYLHSTNAGASAQNSTHHHPTRSTVQTLSPLSRSAKSHCGHQGGQVTSFSSSRFSNPWSKPLSSGDSVMPDKPIEPEHVGPDQEHCAYSVKERKQEGGILQAQIL